MSKIYKAIYMDMIMNRLETKTFDADDDNHALEQARAQSKFPTLLSKVVHMESDTKVRELKIGTDKPLPDITINDKGIMK